MAPTLGLVSLAVEPVGLTAAIAQLVQMGFQGIRALRQTVPEYGKFWDDFEGQLKNEHDVPWDAIVSNCYLQPDFIGWAVGYISGDDAGRQAMEAHFARFIEPPEGARIDNDAIVARVSEAARKSANSAASSDRKAALASRQLVIAAVRDAISQLGSEIQHVHGDLAVIHDSMENLESGIGEILTELSEQRDARIDRTEGAAPPPQFSLDSAEVEALLERAGEVFLEKQRQAPTPEIEARASAGLADARPAPTLSATPGLEALSQQEQLDRLRSVNAAAAAQVERIVRDGGVLALATALRTDALEHDLDILVAAARIVTTSGFLFEAEQAYLRAVELNLDAPTKARQLVRAARLADVQADEARFRRHLDRARELDGENSTLVIAEARHSRDSAYMLARVANVEPFDDEERAVLHQTRAQAHLRLGDEVAARRELELAEAASATNSSVREFGGILVLHEAQQRLASGEEPDIAALRAAGEMFEAMAGQLLTQGRPIEAASIIGRSAEALMIGRQHDRAEAVLRRLPARDLLPDDIAFMVAQTAMLCQQPELVLRLVQDGVSEPEGQLLRAEAQVAVADADDATVAEAVAVIDGFMRGDDEALSKRAAFSVLDTSIWRKEVEWNEGAAEIIRADRPDIAAAMRAERHLLLDEFEQAEAALLPYASTATYQRRLRDYAAAAADWPKVGDRSRQLIRDWNDPSDRLALGHALQHTATPEAAIVEFLKVGRDASVDDSLRDTAFGAAMETVGSRRDYGAILELAREWRNALPNSSNATWNVLFGLARLSEHADAYELARVTRLEAATPERATLLAEIYYRAAPRPEAIATIVSLSDRFDRKVEALEALVIAASLGADPEEVGEPLGHRIGETISSFEGRFPESQTLRSFPAPRSAEEFEAFLKELAGDRPMRQAQLLDAIRDGQAPVNAFAAASPGRVSTTWRRLNIMPLGFATAEHDAADRQAATDALGGAVVFDPSSLVVINCLAEIKDKILRALPGSMITNETLEDVDADTQPIARRVAQSEHHLDGSVTLRGVSPEEEAAADNQAAEILVIAKSLDVQPPLGTGVSHEIEQLYEETEERAEFKVLAATIALAQRLGRPMYTDDRWIRELARSNGIQVFGTVALLDVVAERGIISTRQHQAARLGLTQRGAWGLSLDRSELIVAGRAVSFGLNRTLIGAFHDRAAWRGRPAERFREFGAFLNVAFDERPETFGLWVHRLLDAAHSAVPHMRRTWFAEAVLVMCWGLGDADPHLSEDCFHALVEEIKALPPSLCMPGHDAVMGAIQQFLSLANDRPDDERFPVFCLIVRRLRVFDSVRAIQTFVRPVQ